MCNLQCLCHCRWFSCLCPEVQTSTLLIRRTDEPFTGPHTWVKNIRTNRKHVSVIDMKSLTPSLSLSVSGHLEVMKLLVSHGAEVCCKDKKSYTPLHAAASSGMINVVKYLLNLGVDVSRPRPYVHITPPFGHHDCFYMENTFHMYSQSYKCSN